MIEPSSEAVRRFRAAYAEQRSAEGRGAGGGAELLALPYLETGPQAASWKVRACTFDRFIAAVLTPCAIAAGTRPLRVADLGAGNGWLCYRLALLGHDTVAFDIRADDVDGLAAARSYADHLPRMFARSAASFDALPCRTAEFDIVVFNAALHYALDLPRVLAEAGRVTASGGRIVVLDSPFYDSEEAGRTMVVEKRRAAASVFGTRAPELMALPFIEFLTTDRLAAASAALGLAWRRHRVRYPLWYEARPWLARLRRRRPPSRFDCWEALVP
jgi:SAM-dependent methyltransferase